MNQKFFLMAFAATMILFTCSCGSTRSGAGGYDTGMGVDARGRSYNSYDLVPIGDRITYTIDISTPEGKQKLYKLSLAEAQRLAETEACRKYNCDFTSGVCALGADFPKGCERPGRDLDGACAFFCEKMLVLAFR